MTIHPQWWGYSYSNGTGFRLGFFAAASFLLNDTEKYHHGQIGNKTNSLFILMSHHVKWYPGERSIKDHHCYGQIAGEFLGKYQFIRTLPLLTGGLMVCLLTVQIGKKRGVILLKAFISIVLLWVSGINETTF